MVSLMPRAIWWFCFLHGGQCTTQAVNWAASPSAEWGDVIKVSVALQRDDI